VVRGLPLVRPVRQWLPVHAAVRDEPGLARPVRGLSGTVAHLHRVHPLQAVIYREPYHHYAGADRSGVRVDRADVRRVLRRHAERQLPVVRPVRLLPPVLRGNFNLHGVHGDRHSALLRPQPAALRIRINDLRMPRQHAPAEHVFGLAVFERRHVYRG
jgi:hypothetical protein